MSDESKKIRKIKSSSILGRFEEDILSLPRTPRSSFVDSVASFVYRESQKLMDAQPRVFDNGMRDQIVNFYGRLMELVKNERFEDIPEACVRKCGGIPPIVMLANDIIEDERKAFLASLTKKEREEAESLADAIFGIRKNRRVSFVFMDDFQLLQMDFPKNIRSDSVKDYKDDLINACARAVKTGAGVTVRMWETDEHIAQIFGVQCVNGTWEPLSAEDVRDSYCTGPNGEKIPPKKGVEYIGFERAM